MLSVWRLVSESFANTAFSGEGARIYGGRWNSKGNPVVYCAATQSLALLEMSVQSSPLLPKYSSIEAVIPYDIKIQVISPGDLFDGWRDYVDYEELRTMGDAWFTKREFAVLRIPSAVIPTEYNYLLNPIHPDFAKIEIREPQILDVDNRFF